MRTADAFRRERRRHGRRVHRLSSLPDEIAAVVRGIAATSRHRRRRRRSSCYSRSRSLRGAQRGRTRPHADPSHRTSGAVLRSLPDRQRKRPDPRRTRDCERSRRWNGRAPHRSARFLQSRRHLRPALPIPSAGRSVPLARGRPAARRRIDAGPPFGPEVAHRRRRGPARVHPPVHREQHRVVRRREHDERTRDVRPRALHGRHRRRRRPAERGNPPAPGVGRHGHAGRPGDPDPVSHASVPHRRAAVDAPSGDVDCHRRDSGRRRGLLRRPRARHRHQSL